MLMLVFLVTSSRFRKVKAKKSNLFRKRYGIYLSKASSTCIVLMYSPVYYTTLIFLDLLDKGNKLGGTPGVANQVISLSSIAGLARESEVIVLAYMTSEVTVILLGKILSIFLKTISSEAMLLHPESFQVVAFRKVKRTEA